LQGCSVDPTTGNLGATGAYEGAGAASVVVYPWSGSNFGRPTTYTDSRAHTFAWCGYDDEGNLFGNGSTETGSDVLDKLPEGGNSLENFSIKDAVGGGAVQWDGKYLAMAEPNDGRLLAIYQLRILRTRAKLVNIIELHKFAHQGVQFWLQGDNIVSPQTGHDVGIWRYPAGSAPIKSLYALRDEEGVTISLAPR
jgi:hypothetical protein